ncbi:carbonic anhydrase [Leptodontidium sp. MPI-SDFR-AT-0119]|nr:carbonic anhydrase [Leptodontidium sp. MPI-SDFR-AT-0119]
MDPRIKGYLERNREWAEREDYVPPICFVDMQRKGRERVDGTVIVVACTDPRVTPEEFLGMDSSSKATVVRTAGGRVHAAMSTLLVLSAVGNAGKKGVIMVVHHTDCGLQTADEEAIRGVLRESVEGGGEGRWKDREVERVLEGVRFGAFVNPDESVKEDVGILKDSPFFKGMQILGFVQDTETGLLKEVIGVE